MTPIPYTVKYDEILSAKTGNFIEMNLDMCLKFCKSLFGKISQYNFYKENVFFFFKLMKYHNITCITKMFGFFKLMKSKINLFSFYQLKLKFDLMKGKVDIGT